MFQLANLMINQKEISNLGYKLPLPYTDYAQVSIFMLFICRSFQTPDHSFSMARQRYILRKRTMYMPGKPGG